LVSGISEKGVGHGYALRQKKGGAPSARERKKDTRKERRGWGEQSQPLPTPFGEKKPP